MNKYDYAIKMIKYHSRLLIKWSKYIEKTINFKEKEKDFEIPKGQINLFEIIEDKDNKKSQG